MNCADLAKILMQTPTAAVLSKVANDWVEVWGVIPTGQHRNALTLNTRMPGGGVMVVEPDAVPQSDARANKLKEKT